MTQKPRSATAQRFRAFRIVNTYDLVSRFGTRNVDDYAMTYHPWAPRSVTAARTLIWSPHRKLDANAHFDDHGAVALVGDRAKSRSAALAWAKKHLKIADWAPCPVAPSELIPKTVRERALAWLKEREKEAKSP